MDSYHPRKRKPETSETAFPYCVHVELEYFFNNVGSTEQENLHLGGLNVWGNSFPSNELPEGDQIVYVTDVTFRFPPSTRGRRNNVVCAGQRIDLPAARYDWIYILACSERRTEDSVYLHYASGAVDPEWLRVSDLWPGSPPHFGEVEAIRCGSIHFPRHAQPRVEPVIWQQRIPVPRQEELAAIRLPENIATHIFAMTAIESRRGADES